MWKLMCVFAVTGACALSGGGSALAASGGDANGGDVWLDNVGQPAGPGHEMDPHLACTSINLWGSGLSDPGGTFSIDGWPPSGRQEVDYSDKWSYSGPGEEVIAIIDVSKLIRQAEAGGDKPSAQGYHFKLDFSQDPQKHKTFWLSCDPTTGGGGSGGGGSGGGPSGGAGSSSGSIPAPAGTTGAPLALVKTAISATHKTRPKRHRHRRARPARHRRAHKRALRSTRRRLPTFTG